MRAIAFFVLAGSLFTWLPGCGQQMVPFNPVTVVATRTPGVAMVIVRPVSNKQASKGEIDRWSEYVMLCDARGADGMHCAIMPEVGADRRSRGIVPDQPAPTVEEGLSTLSDVDVQYSEAGGSVARSSPVTVAAPAATTTPSPPAAAPPPPPPPPPSSPPPAAPAAPAGGVK